MLAEWVKGSIMKSVSQSDNTSMPVSHQELISYLTPIVRIY